MCLGHIHPHYSILSLSHFHWSSPSSQSYRSGFEGLFTRVWATDSGYYHRRKGLSFNSHYLPKYPQESVRSHESLPTPWQGNEGPNLVQVTTASGVQKNAKCAQKTACYSPSTLLSTLIFLPPLWGMFPQFWSGWFRCSIWDWAANMKTLTFSIWITCESLQ